MTITRAEVLWTILGPTEIRKRERYLLCRCSCGTEKYVGKKSLERGKSLTCGHGRAELISKLKTGKPSLRYPDGIGMIKQVYRKTVRQSVERNRECTLTLEQFAQIVKQDCYYCGLSPSNIAKHSRGVSHILVSGIDRVDNTIGYIKENCVPCCKHCNRAKSDLTEAEFFQWIKRLTGRFINVNN